MARDSHAPARARRRALVLLNDDARNVAAKSSDAIVALQELGLDIVHAVTATRSSVAAAIREHADRVDLVIAGGGDGTLNAVLQGLVGSKLPLGILPLGTANDLAKTLGIPAELPRACEVIGQGHTRRIDVGRVNDVYYFNEASIGMSVALCRRLTKESKSSFGVFALLFHALQIVFAMRRFRALVTLPSGEVIAQRTAQLTVGNGQNFGGFVATDEAAIDDRKLDLYSVQLKDWKDYLEVLTALLRRQYDDVRSVFTLHGKRFEVKTGKRMRIEVDGEIVTSTPATFDIVPSAIEVLVPAPSPAVETGEA
ncbi:MAG TPA: lipid kinase [Candidatus Eremiobacteraceae bacterium]|nr:lipid kinase [Candidatus Eremiobacteraceae bacterium]